MARKRRAPNVVDSSAWLAYLAAEPGADHFAAAIEDTASLVVPAICILEVFKVALRERGESEALQAAALMQQGRVVDLDASLALAAAKLGVEYKLPLADSIVYAVANLVNGVVWTQDEHFDGLADVKYFQRRVR
ncbi:MAG: type II toxin-antitoxin system VapC family toxin [Gemmatimonadaceae bacterium]